MLGAIIGDIAGSRFEWQNIKTKDFEFMTHLHGCKPTDDSIMSLAIDQLDEYGIEVRSTIGNSQITHEHIDQLRAIFNNPIVKEFKLKE